MHTPDSSGQTLLPTGATGAAACLIIGVGNRGRGDDALGPALIEQLQALELAGVELLEVFQLQVEHCLDLQGRRQVVFADASLQGTAPYAFEPLRPAARVGALSHALAPAQLLALYRQLYGEPPPAHVLAMRGYDFTPGAALSDAARRHLHAAVDFLVHWLAPDRLAG
ncbi:MAG: hydrogenase maturation protease [Thiobacillaceae bacterium]|nr:hydrogenase maturation protease [Thiobacillaceae bacterium]MCX7673148.1 hydrogenase maturation protease [Thiobacillaceae bacterium]MDW8322895.1 hydrogenase maturation protease [Burkholderiales bacterium]